MREQAMVEGIPFEEIRERREREDAETAAEADAKKKDKLGSASTKKKSGALALAKKKFAKKNEVEFTIKMKDEEGKIVEFESIEEHPPVVAKKKKKTVKAKAGTENKVNVPEIEAEDTLAMIKNALKSGPGQMAQEFGNLDDIESKPKKKKKKPTSASNKKKVK